VIWLVQLVFDCADPDAITQFWGRALRYRNPLVGAPAAEVAAFRTAHPQFDGRGRIDDNDLRRPPVYLQRVPESKAGPNRVRLEIAAADEHATVERLLGLGATRRADGTIADVEGNELTVVRSDGPDDRLRSIVIDAEDPDRLLTFWSAATGYAADAERLRCDPLPSELAWSGRHFSLGDQRLLHICGAGAAPGPARFDLVPGLSFVPTGAPKAGKNRIHLDLNSTDVAADRAHLERLGATVLRWDADRVLADPEGNELCLSGTN
jgi:hypothetical protein